MMLANGPLLAYNPSQGIHTPVLSTGRGHFASMNDQRILEELLALLEAHKVKIRREPLGGRGGGLAAMKGEKIFFVDTDAASAEVATLCADAVVKLVDIEAIYLRPEVRLFLEGHD